MKSIFCLALILSIVAPVFAEEVKPMTATEKMASDKYVHNRSFHKAPPAYSKPSFDRHAEKRKQRAIRWYKEHHS